MNSETVDLIYLDPPFNSKRDYSAPIGSKAAGAHFKDMWSLDDIEEEWIDMLIVDHTELYNALLIAPTNSDKAYLAYMIPRILEMKRLLKPTGSIYLHCDPTMSHYLKIFMDVIFGNRRFQNEFIWYYSGGGASKKRWARKHDVLLFYTNGEKWTFNADAVRVPHKWTDGQRRADGSERSKKGKLPDDVWEQHSVMPWSKERTGYPTQKPLLLLERIIKASSNEGDIVLDPFCGCATTCIAADKLNRKWVGIDISAKAADLVILRMRDELGVFSHDVIHRKDIPRRTDQGRLSKYNCKEKREHLYGKQGGTCRGCNDHFIPKILEVDHIIAQSKGGTDHLENLQLLCSNCNRRKGNRGMEYLRSVLKLTS